jgi:hypothetical protein
MKKIIYAFVQAAVKHALAQFSVTPTLDFEFDASIQQLSSIQQPFTEEKKSAATSGSIFKGFTEKNKAHFIEPTNRSELKALERLLLKVGSQGVEDSGSREKMFNNQCSMLNLQLKTGQLIHHSSFNIPRY